MPDGRAGRPSWVATSPPTEAEADQALALDSQNLAAAKAQGADLTAPYWRTRRSRTRRLRRRVRRHQLARLLPRRRDRRPPGGRPRARRTSRATRAGPSRSDPDEPGEHDLAPTEAAG
jgi:hypothetical protein